MQHMQTHAHITPPGEDVCEEGMSEFFAPENYCAKHFSLFPMQQHSSINIHSGPLRAQVFFLQPSLRLTDILSSLTKQSAL